MSDAENKVESPVQIAKELKEDIEISASEEKTYIVVLAIHKDKNRNVIQRIPCRNGTPIGSYVKEISSKDYSASYDVQSDAYHAECCDYLYLGIIPISYSATVPGTNWITKIPLSENVMKKFMTKLQILELKNFKNHFNLDEHTIQFIQLIDCN